MASHGETTLVTVLTTARSGALDRAWRLFTEAGLDQVVDDPAVLVVLGRLLKYRAAGARGEERRKFYLDASDAYAKAHALDGATYPLINAATLSLLGGKAEASRALAAKALALLESGPELDTPYYSEATRAEALLLTGDTAEARAALGAAEARAPHAYEDHAITLRQFSLILDAQNADKAWLDAYRPPRVVCFAGHIALSPENGDIAPRIADVLAQERIGYGFGALAAGADILVAEALLARGAELHLVLPAGRKQFRENSVAKFGADWAARYDRIMEAAQEVRLIEPERPSLSPLAIRLASEVAAGLAVMQADTLLTDAVQLLILDPEASYEIAGRWTQSGRRQHMLTAARAPSQQSELTDAAWSRIAAMLRLVLPASGDLLLPRLAEALAGRTGQLLPPRLVDDDTVTCAFISAEAAADAALGAAEALGGLAELRVAGHYGLVELAPDPFGSGHYLRGAEARLPTEMIASTPPGAIHVSENFAASLCSGRRHEDKRVEFVGELAAVEDALRLYSLKR